MPEPWTTRMNDPAARLNDSAELGDDRSTDTLRDDACAQSDGRTCSVNAAPPRASRRDAWLPVAHRAPHVLRLPGRDSARAQRLAIVDRPGPGTPRSAGRRVAPRPGRPGR